MPPRSSSVFRALADPTRRMLFEQLRLRGELNIRAITAFAGISQPAVSKQMAILRQARLVRRRRVGRETHFRAQPEALAPVADWLREYGAFWQERMNKLESVLERMES